MGVARPLAGAALAAVLLALSGCSAIIAAAGRPDDLSVVRRGALRDDVEHELGRPSRERAAGHGIEATYKVRVGPGGSPSANAGAVARAGLDTFESVTVARRKRKLVVNYDADQRVTAHRLVR